MTLAKAMPKKKGPARSRAGSAPARRVGSRRAGRTPSASDNRLGHEVRSLRTAKSFSLKELATKASLSIGMVSQIERGLTSPSIRSIKNIAEALEVPISWFFHESDHGNPEEAGKIVRANGRRKLRLPKLGVAKDLLTPDMSGELEMLLVTIEVNGTSGPELYTHQGEEAGLVLSGSIELVIDKQTFRLHEGDAFRFPSTVPHRFRNIGKTQSQVLWVITPPLY
jgi:transcriptional regulator with XRE-family HTH domain